MTTKEVSAKQSTRMGRSSHLGWVKVSDLEVYEPTQRKFRKAWALHIANNLDPDLLGVIEVNQRDGRVFVIDGQHRYMAMKLAGYGDQSMQADIFSDLTDAEMAARFLGRNNVKQIGTFDKFRVRITADDAPACDINRTVLAQGLKVSQAGDDDCISAVGALEYAYNRVGPERLGAGLRILRDAFQDPRAFRAEYVKGIALFIEVYDGHPNYDEAHLIAELSKRDTRWLGFSTQEARATFGWNLPKCVGKVLCDVHNTARRTKKLPPWAGQMG